MIPSRFCRRPIMVEAVRLTKTNRHDVLAWVQSQSVYAYLSAHGLIVGALEGEMHALPGDWVVRDSDGRFFPVKDSAFEETYVAMEDVA